MDKYAIIAGDSKTVDEALKTLHETGATAIHAIKALHYGRGMSAREAKSALRASPIWAEEVQTAEYMLHQILKELDEQ